MLNSSDYKRLGLDALDREAEQDALNDIANEQINDRIAELIADDPELSQDEADEIAREEMERPDTYDYEYDPGDYFGDKS